MIFFSFFAGFFRQNANESSTRLVGIVSMLVGCALAAYLVLERHATPAGVLHTAPSPTDLGVVAMLFSNGLIALGLRKPAGADQVDVLAVAAVAAATPPGS